ncbi:hypothetical protein KM043_013807 [Ampulex compressa]|nr:hypothetical protein KM043_013807 [Ampulex compressa]
MEEDLASVNSSATNSFEIIINTIENLVTKEGLSVKFCITHNDITLGESDPVTIESGFKDPPLVYDVNFVAKLPIIFNDRSSIDGIVSVPILVKAVHDTVNESDKKSSVSDTGSKKKSKFTDRPSPVMPKVIGICSLDLMPLLLGEMSFTEKIALETPQFSFDGSAVSWPNLPLLTITIQQRDSYAFRPKDEVNFLTITIESIYNPLVSFTDDLEYKAGTVTYNDNEEVETITFEGGKWKKYRDVERTKIWRTLQKLESRAKYSKYKLDCDYMGVKNTCERDLDLERKTWEDAPRIEWNSMSRSFLSPECARTMQKHIERYRYWPFEFIITERDLEPKRGKTREGSAAKIQLYQCYVDLTELLFPGKKSTRVAAQLTTYNASDITEKAGLEKNIFSLEALGKDSKDKEKKEKSSKHTSYVESDLEMSPATPLMIEDDKPTFVIIEVELYRPFIASRIEADFSSLIGKMMTKTKQKPSYSYSADVAESQYSNCIRKLAEIITESYRDFVEETKNEQIEKSGENKEEFKYYCTPENDELTRFTQYLYKTGTYLTVSNTLKDKVILLLDQKFNMNFDALDSTESQNFIVNAYTYLVEQMHVVINKIVEGRSLDDSQETVDLKNLYFYADEAYELGHVENAKRHYTKAIALDINNPESWIKYAIFLLKTGDKKRAKECCREAINLNGRHKLALIMYAVILAGEEEYKDAEIILRAVTDLYPRFIEGWTTLHLLYIRTEYYPGVDLTIRIAEKCMTDKDRETELFHEEPLAWSMIHCPLNSAYAITLTFLLKLHLCEFANIALAQEMSNAGRSTHVLYYMAVEHFLSHKYEDARSHLKEAQHQYGMDYSISSLMGHCHFREGNLTESIRCYEFANMVFNRPDDLHLVNIKLGMYYHEVGYYERARKVFLNACQYSPSSETWLGAGISFYELGAFDKAEAALMEANNIDNCNAEIWAYLCLLNMSLGRYHEFAQCYRELTRNNLENTKLWLAVTKSMEALNYAAPIISGKKAARADRRENDTTVETDSDVRIQIRS